MAIAVSSAQQQYLTNPADLAALRTTASLSFWIKTTQVGSDTFWQTPGVAGIEHGGGDDDIFWGIIDNNGGASRIGVARGNGAWIKSAGAINDGALRHVVLTWNSSTGAAQVFVNGALSGSGTTSSGDVSASHMFYDLCRITGYGPMFLGATLSDVRVYSRVLSAVEVAIIYSCQGRDAVRNGIVHRWLGLEDRPSWGVIAEVPDLAGAKPMWPRGVPPLIVEMLMREGAGTTTGNTGASRAGFPTGTITATSPIWSTNVPPNRSRYSLDWGTSTAARYAVDLPLAGGPLTNLQALTSFTICGWLNCRSSSMGSGGNRVVVWSPIIPTADGVDLVYINDGSLKVGIDQWPDSSPAYSSAGKIPTDAGAGAANWRFFAVTYDSTLGSSHVKFYFGTPSADAALDVARTYAQGVTGSAISVSMTLGMFAPNGVGNDRMFRGLINSVRIYGATSGGGAALSLSDIVKLQWGNPVALPMYEESFVGAGRRHPN